MGPHKRSNLNIDPKLIGRIILDLADTFNIRVVWEHEAAILTGAFALVGALVGGNTGYQYGDVVGAGIGAAVGLGVSTVVSLREIWESKGEQLMELTYIVVNYLRRFDAADYVKAYNIVKACVSSRRELVEAVLEFIRQKLGGEAYSNI